MMLFYEMSQDTHEDRTLCVWDIADGSLLETWDAVKDTEKWRLSCISFSPDNIGISIASARNNEIAVVRSV